MSKNQLNYRRSTLHYDSNDKQSVNIWKNKAQKLSLALKNVQEDNIELRTSALRRIQQIQNQIQAIFKIYSNRSIYSRQSGRTQIEIDEIKKTYDIVKANNQMLSLELKNKQNDKDKFLKASQQISQLKLNITKIKKQLNVKIKQIHDLKRENKDLLLAFEEPKSKKSSSLLKLISNDHNQSQSIDHKRYHNHKNPSDLELTKHKIINLSNTINNSMIKQHLNDIKSQRNIRITTDEDQIIRLIRQSVEAVIIQKDHEYAQITQQLELKNNQHLVDIMTLEGSVMLLRKQLGETLNHQVNEQIHLKFKGLKSFSKLSQRMPIYSPKNYSETLEKYPQHYMTPRGYWKNNLSIFRSTHTLDRSEIDQNGQSQQLTHQRRRNCFIPCFKQEAISQVFEPGQSLRIYK